MKKTSLCLLLVLASIAAFAGPVPHEWRARYKKLEKVFASKNISDLSAMCANDLVWVQVDGTKKNREETFKEFEGMFQAEKVVVHEKLLGVVKRGVLVDVSCEVFAKLVFPGRTDTRLHSFCIDSWKKVGGKWLLVKTVDTKVEVARGK